MGSQQMLGIENVLFTIAMLLYFASMVTYFAFIAAKKDGIAKAAFLIQIAGFVLHTAALICRGIGAGRLPLTNQYEFATSFAWGICLVCLVFVRKYQNFFVFFAQQPQNAGLNLRTGAAHSGFQLLSVKPGERFLRDRVPAAVHLSEVFS